MKAAPSMKRARRRPATPQRERLEFEPVEHSVYIGRQRLGHYVRIGVRRYAAYDLRNRLLGSFTKRADALAAIDGIGGEQ
jgi:hypothetical protein